MIKKRRKSKEMLRSRRTREKKRKRK